MSDTTDDAGAAMQAELQALRQRVAALEAQLQTRTETEQSQHQDQERWQLFVMHAPVAIAVFDDQMRYLAVSDRWQTAFCCGVQHVIGRVHYDIFPQIPEDWKAAHQRALAGSVERRDEDRFVHRDNTVQWLRWEVQPWQHPNGEIGGIIIFSEDITARKEAEAALRQSEERWQLALRGSNAGIWDWNPQTNNVFFSTRWKTMLGFTDDEIGPSLTEWSDRVHPDDRARVMRELSAHVAGTTDFYESEHRVRSKDGKYKWILARGQALWDTDGKVIRMVGAHSDITRRKQMELALQAHEEQLQLAQEAANVGLWSMDVAADRVWSSTELRRMMGFLADEEPRDGQWLQVVHPDDRAKVEAMLQAARTGAGDFAYEFRIAHPERGEQWILARGHVVPAADGSGSLVRGATIDITEQKRLSEQIRRNESWLRGLVETTQDALISIDRQARIVLFNPAAERIFGYHNAEVCGQKINLLMPEPFASEHDSYIARYEETREQRALGRIRVVTARRKNGEIFPIELSLTEIHADDEVHYAAFMRDISEKVRLQEKLMEQERLATIGVTAATLAHEVGNPLNSMALSLQMLERRVARVGSDEMIIKRIRDLHDQVARLARLLQDFRMLARQQHYQLQPTNLTAVVTEVLAAERDLYAAQGIMVIHNSAPALPLVKANADKLRQVLANLCKNAMEAMPTGGTLTVREQPSGQRHVHLHISDTGNGIPDGVNIFEPFVTTKPEGTGLGLPVVQQIIAAHDGELSYRTMRGQGTTFTVTLVAVEEDALTPPDTGRFGKRTGEE